MLDYCMIEDYMIDYCMIDIFMIKHLHDKILPESWEDHQFATTYLTFFGKGSVKKKCFLIWATQRNAAFCMVFSMSQISYIKYFLGVVKFLPFLLYFMGNFGVKNFQVFKDGLKLVLPDRTGI